MADIWTPPTSPKTPDLTAAAYLNAEVRDNVTVGEKVIVTDDSSQFAHQHMNGALALRPPAGKVAREYYATDMGVCFFDNGSDWRYLWHNPRLCDRYYYQFELDRRGTIGPPIPDEEEQPVSHGWQAFKNGADAGTLLQQNGQEGVLIRTGAGVGSRVFFSPHGSEKEAPNTTHSAAVPGGPVPMSWEIRVRIHDNADLDAAFGVFDQIRSQARPFAPGDALLWRVQDGGLYNCFSQGNAGADEETQTDVVAGPASGNAVTKTLRIDWLTVPSGVNGDGLVKFYADGVLKATHTRVPTLTELMMGFYARSNAASTRDFTIVYIHALLRRVTF